MTNEQILNIEIDKLIANEPAGTYISKEEILKTPEYQMCLDIMDAARNDERLHNFVQVPIVEAFREPLGTEESREVWKRIFTVAGYVILKPTE